MNILKLDTTNSTNTWLADNEQTIPSPSLVYCINQTAGRGQRGNSWESEPGKNITASLIFHPRDFHASLQFRISEAIALSLVDYLERKGINAKVKWPNDIYVGEKKICGILVEHMVMGKYIGRTIAGFGLNVNQKKFLSDAPNPVSLTQLTGQTYQIEIEIEELASILKRGLEQINDPDLHSVFLDKLWRNDGDYYKFKDRKKNEQIEAVIENVAPDGLLSLITRQGERREFAFKEVEFIL